jgi:hypothetical protein
LKRANWINSETDEVLHPYYPKIETLRLMKYTNYLSQMLSAQGAPNMDTEYFKTLMNVVHLEGQLKALMKQRKQAEKSSEPHRYDLEFFNTERKLYGMKNDVPSDIFVKVRILIVKDVSSSTQCGFWLRIKAILYNHIKELYVTVTYIRLLGTI